MNTLLLKTFVVFIFITTSFGFSYGNWLLERKVDPIDDTISVYAGVIQTGGILVVSCVRKIHISVSIDWGGFWPFGYLSLNKREKYKSLIVRFDKKAPENTAWFLGSKGRVTTLFADNFRFIDKLKKHSKLAVRAKKTNGETITIVFSLAGSTYPIEMVEYTCGLREKKPQKKMFENKVGKEIF